MATNHNVYWIYTDLVAKTYFCHVKLPYSKMTSYPLHDAKYHDFSIVEVASAAEKYTMITIGRKSKVPLVGLAHVVTILEECL